MKVGDLVRYTGFPHSAGDPFDLGLGIVLGFDEEGDPAIYFQLEKNTELGGKFYYSKRIEVISECR